MLKRKINILFAISLFTFTACSSPDLTQNNLSNTSNVNTLSLPAGAPKLEIKVNNNPTDGEILIAPFKQGDKSGSIMILDKFGNVLKYKRTASEALNLQKWDINGQVRYSYLEHQPSANSMSNSISNIPGSIVVLDQDLNELKRIRLLPNNGRTANDPDEVDAHDFILIDDNHYLVMSYYPKVVNNIPSELKPDPKTTVIAAIIQEVENDQVVWEWDSTSKPELYGISVEGNDYANATIQNDYVHINSMIIDPKDQNLICSFRDLSQILKIDRKTGNIIWRFGGKNSDFPLTADQKFYFQHNATLTDDGKTLLFFDNGSSTARPYTRIVEYQLDEVNKTVTSFKSMNSPKNIFSQYMGSVQKRGDTYFIGWGTIPRVSEINYKTGEMTFDMNLEKNTYRAFKY